VYGGLKINGTGNNMKTGKIKDKTYTSHNRFKNRQLLYERFEKSKAKLFNVNQWSGLPGITSSFQLYAPTGEKIFREKPRVNDYIKIVLPGPFPENWVVVSGITEEVDLANFRVHPSENPVDKWQQQKEIEHFFIKEASSTFQVQIKGTSIYAYEIGKNEAINNEGYEAGDRKLINTILAKGGWAGFQKYQWQKVLDYLVHKIEIE
jgi:hypothetical protein